MEEEEQPIVEEKSKSLEQLYIFLRIIPIVFLLIVVYLFLTNQGSNSINPGMQTLIDNMPLIEYGMAGLINLICLVLAFITRKEAPKLAIFFLIAGIAVPLIVWYLHTTFPEPQIVPAPALD